MKLDAESPYHPTFPSQEHAAKVSGHNESHFIVPKDKNFVINMIKVDNVVINEDNNWETFEEMDLPQCRNCSILHNDMSMEDSIDNNNGQHSEPMYSFEAAEIGLLEKEVIFSDKTIAKVELPGEEACVKNDACHIIKDICIDEGVNSTGKDSVTNDEVEQNNSFSDDKSPRSINNDLGEEMSGTACSYDVKYAILNGDPVMAQRNPANVVPILDKDNEQNPHSTESSFIGECELNRNELLTDNISVEEAAGKEPLSLQEIDTGSSPVDSSSFNYTDDQKQSTDRQSIDQCALEDVNSASIVVCSAPEVSSNNNGAEEVIASGKVQSGVITFHFDSEAVLTSGRGGKTECVDSEQQGHAQSGPGTEEATLDGVVASSQRSSVHHVRGDSSSYGPAFLSAPVASSGHIPYSGSISLRSDSSTTSARSFAFPILQSEWNSSPVKMAKADRRRHRGWRVGLLCCRF